MIGTKGVFDPLLPGLAGALDPQLMSSRLVPLLDDAPPRGCRAMAVEVLKHKPGRRCSLSYLLEGPGWQGRLFAKTYAGNRGAGIFTVMEQLFRTLPRQELVVPCPLAYFSDMKLLVTEYIDGVPFAQSLYLEPSDGAACRAASALAALHGCSASLARRWTAVHEVNNTERWTAVLSGRAGREPERARLLLSELQARARDLEVVPESTVHRDFYAEQLWDAGGTTAMLDLDDTRSGDGALDVGNFLAHLTLRLMQFPGTATGCAQAREPFLREYSRRAAGRILGSAFQERVRFYEAASLLRLACVYAARERWSGSLPPLLLDAAEHLLSGGMPR